MQSRLGHPIPYPAAHSRLAIPGLAIAAVVAGLWWVQRRQARRPAGFDDLGGYGADGAEPIHPMATIVPGADDMPMPEPATI